ncbi:MAG: site-2 protease family protein [Burkholderiaceae bacterium]|jgi:Zn-dependent protease
MEYNLIQTIAVYALPVIFAITLHEAAHGYIAQWFGDNTAHERGRVTLNPLKHIDPVGTIVVPFAILAASSLFGGSPMLFGWAKPVPVDFGRLREPKRQMRYVAAAGPVSNLLMALAWAAALKLQLTGSSGEPFFLNMAKAGMEINLVLAVLNMLPILPLDGGRVLFSLLPARAAQAYARTEAYGMPILLLLMIFNLLPLLITPAAVLGLKSLVLLFNI